MVANKNSSNGSRRNSIKSLDGSTLPLRIREKDLDYQARHVLTLSLRCIRLHFRQIASFTSGVCSKGSHLPSAAFSLPPHLTADLSSSAYVIREARLDIPPLYRAPAVGRAARRYGRSH